MKTNRSIPRCSVIPELGYPDVSEAAAWLCDVFGFTVRLRIANHRIQLNVGDCAVVLTEAAGDVTGHSVMVRVEDAHAHHRRAVEHGAHIVREPADHPYGERQYTAQDHVGRCWKFSESIADVAPEEWGGESGAL